MNPRVTAVLVLALLISGGATYLVYRVVVSRAAQAPAQQTTQVAMAARDLEIGTLIKDSDITTGPWTGSLPKGLVTKKETLVGRGVIAPIYQGEPVMENRLAPPGAGGGLAATIPPGMRAVAVRVNEIIGVAGFATPGMRVDVLISGIPPGAQAQFGAKVKTLLQNIEVLSAGQNYQKDAEGKPVAVPVVNLLVNPEQAELLSLASTPRANSISTAEPARYAAGENAGQCGGGALRRAGDAPRRSRPRECASFRPPPSILRPRLKKSSPCQRT